jgi:hypothetical protein
VTVKQGPFPIAVEPWDGEAPQIVGADPQFIPDQKPEVIGKDIVFIKNSPGRWLPVSKILLYQRWSFWLICAGFVVAWFGAWLMARRHRRFNTDQRFRQTVPGV